MTPHRAVRSGDFVRRVGDDIQPGDVAVASGAILGPAQIGLLAAVGREKVLAYPRPRVSIISFGRELVDVDRDPGLGQVFDVNSYSLAAAAKDAGADVHWWASRKANRVVLKRCWNRRSCGARSS